MSFYQPLDEGEVRLLWFLDDSGHNCQLQKHSKGDVPSYAALSYTWELDRLSIALHDYSVMINGERAVVKRNLYDALTYLAPSLRAQGLPLWVDAVCINQKDVHERNTQVKNMKLIYEDAREVCAWLGVPADEERTRLAVDLIHQINADAQRVDAITGKHLLYPTPARRNICTAWDGVAELTGNKYWQRTWIGQEATTPTSLKFHCGHHQFNFWSLFGTINLSGIFSRLPESRGIPSLRAVTENKTLIGLLLSWYARKSGMRKELLDLLVTSRLTTCADPKDKVFAAWGHAVDVSDQDVLQVDYTKSTCDVFTNVVRHVLNTSPARIWELLGYVVPRVASSRSEYLREAFTESPVPSWVPDWRRRVLITPIAARNTDNTPIYNPWPGTTIDARITDEGFEATGMLVKTVKILFLTTCWENTDPNLVQGQQARWRDSGIRSGLIDGLDLDGIWRKALVGDRTPASNVEDTGVWLPPYRRLHKHDSDFGEEHVQIAQFCYGRRMGVLNDRRIGIFPATAETGDVLVVFSGGGALHVVKPVTGYPDRWEFVGECYVDGMMDGALVQREMESGNLPVNIILV